MLLPLLLAIPAGMIHSSATLLLSIEAYKISIKQRDKKIRSIVIEPEIAKHGGKFAVVVSDGIVN
jgi:hypothetical protein